MCQISIVLPVYNGEDHIAGAIESILSQTYKDFELIIVNDCSTDCTKAIVEQYVQKDARIKLINNSENRRLPASLNIGFSSASGKYFTWTSDDNKFLPEALEEMVQEMDNHSQYGMVYCNYWTIDRQDNRISEVILEEPNVLIKGNVIGACFLYRRDVALQVGDYDVNMFLAEDYDYWIRIYKSSVIKHINKTLYLYRVHEKSLSATRVNDIKKQTAKLWMKHIDFILKKQRNLSEVITLFDKICDCFSGNEKDDTRRILCEYSLVYNFICKTRRISEVIHGR